MLAVCLTPKFVFRLPPSSSTPTRSSHLGARPIRLHHSSSQTPKRPLIVPTPSPQPTQLSLEAINRTYFAHFHPLASALQSIHPFPSRPINIIADYAKSEFSIYSLAPELIDPKIPLCNSLKQAPYSDRNGQNKRRIKRLKSPESGDNGKVKFVQFKEDPDENRWFAIKQPSLSIPTALSPTIYEPLSSKEVLKYYDNNCRISSKTCNHPNFMKVFGVVVKESANDGKTIGEELNVQDFSPYLILEYLEGDLLSSLMKANKLSLQDQQNILKQFVHAMLFLFKASILPKDAHSYNLIFTKSQQLKFIDFDFWQEIPPSHPELAESLYQVAVEFFKELGNHAAGKLSVYTHYPIPPFIRDGDDARSLETSLQQLLMWFEQLPKEKDTA